VKNDVVVIGSGPNGLAAAITVARTGRSVTVHEAEETVGGGARSAELTLPGFIHDVCSSVHPMAAASRFFNSIPLQDWGLQWVHPEAPLAHPFGDGTAILVHRSLAQTSAQFGVDERAVRAIFQPLVESWEQLSSDILRPARIPRHPGILARFARNALPSAVAVAHRRFKTPKARAVFAGMSAHSILRLTSVGSSAFGTLLWTTCHAVGWPFARGGSQAITNALSSYLESLGGKIVAGSRVNSLDDLPRDAVVLCDVTPRQFVEIGGGRISRREREKLQKYRYGPCAFKIDWSLDAPIPWNAPACSKAGTVHVGGTLEEIAESEDAAWGASASRSPFVLVTQPSLFDPTRAPSGKHTAWGYCHVPHASSEDMVERIEAQVERFASGFRRHIIGRSVMSPAELESHNSNLVGGDIGAGSFYASRFSLGFTDRAYETSIPGVFLCSASTPPGPGVHGLCGYFAAQRAIKRSFPSR
jgi:phytoene dehydrogenase-like protein